MPSAPLVGLPSDRKQIGHHPFQAVGEKYIRAVVDAAGCVPMLIPSLSPPLDLPDLLSRLDGLLLTGAYSNIEPHHYGSEASYAGNLHDPARDANTLSLVPLAIRMKVPVLALCRGLQEVNVALGGSLYQKVHETPGFHDHREDLDATLDDQYGPAHPVQLSAGGLLAKIAGASEVIVNSLHGQGIRDLGAGLRVEARAADGLVEAVSLASEESFLLAVQWHPEWKVHESPFYLGTFQAFAAACRERAEKRTSQRA
ncbi:MAG TPA: gamma-glutamyl-gamma-aminobutyrate hydrolase family protein [Arenimonas sp.]|uniref:gamma-glutamyl-gamma-aminobutyrate hydrolase family protein n=1 Tax=Arenimonas sp. TaxID=1872635 RepID=UPI002D176525|nr:gamma-glutamyl-gamma-aminobutyrate hydrolase family protein [Arenimonas sp.]HMB56497.1 gamma-glutamyl-gamma-aminobutyrate hydrolase family protein [Arenimonas sp.]